MAKKYDGLVKELEAADKAGAIVSVGVLTLSKDEREMAGDQLSTVVELKAANVLDALVRGVCDQFAAPVPPKHEVKPRRKHKRA